MVSPKPGAPMITSCKRHILTREACCPDICMGHVICGQTTNVLVGLNGWPMAAQDRQAEFVFLAMKYDLSLLQLKGPVEATDAGKERCQLHLSALVAARSATARVHFIG